MRKHTSIGNSFRFISETFKQNKAISYFVLMLLAIIWELIVLLNEVPKYVLPAPTVIIKAIMENREILWLHTKTTVFEALTGFAIATVTAVIIATLMNYSKLLKEILYPIFVITQTIPIIAIAPLFMIWIGFGIITKIVIVISICFFPITVSVVEGLEAVDKDLINLMKVMKANPWQIFKKVQLPSVMPSFFSGLKIAATYSITGAVIGELIGAKNGLGIYLTRAMNSFRIDALFADILIIVVLSILLFNFIELIGKLIMPWNK